MSEAISVVVEGSLDDTLSYRVTLTDTISVPVQYLPKRTIPWMPDGEGKIIGFTLPDGRIIRPQISFEIADSNDDNHVDMTYQELIDLGILTGDDLCREIEEEEEN